MAETDIRAIPAIDFHSHFGPPNCEAEAYYAGIIEDGSISYLLRTMRLSNIAVSINSHNFALLPREKGDALRGNRMLLEQLDVLPGVYGWVVVNPLVPETYRQAAELLKHPKVFGIKVHPEEHQYPIRKYGEKIYEFAAEQGCTIITHSGEENSLPEDFCTFANHYPTVKTIVSHIGCGYDGCFEHQIRAIEANTQNNLYTDTSSARSMMARLIEYAVARIGYGRILFGTDSTCYFSPSQRARIDCADISDEAKCAILYGNALRVFPEIGEAYRREISTSHPPT